MIRTVYAFNYTSTNTIHHLVSLYRYDEAQLRFKKGSKLDDNFYVRQDGTCSYFFDLTELNALCESLGFRHDESHYVRRQYANRQQKVARHRVWIHAKYVKL